MNCSVYILSKCLFKIKVQWFAQWFNSKWKYLEVLYLFIWRFYTLKIVIWWKTDGLVSFDLNNLKICFSKSVVDIICSSIFVWISIWTVQYFIVEDKTTKHSSLQRLDLDDLTEVLNAELTLNPLVKAKKKMKTCFTQLIEKYVLY
jgi:hypothetical protein